jgi:hypothetical protein
MYIKMKSAIFFVLMTTVSADVCTDPSTTREQFIESLCCDRPCVPSEGGSSDLTLNGLVCSASEECVSNDCRQKCCAVGVTSGCDVCNAEGSCATCKAGFSLTESTHPDAGLFKSMGLPIVGENQGDNSGHDLGFSSDGSVVAISSKLNDAGGVPGAKRGHVRVYKWDGTAWQQRGADIDGENDLNEFGHAAELNQDGSVLAVSSVLHDTGGLSNVGHVRVFDWDGSSWNQRGSDIVGSNSGENVGWDISLSADGDMMIVGIPNKPNSGDKGQIVVYEWNGSAWLQKGSSLEGDFAGDKVGKKVSISGDGTKIAFITNFYTVTSSDVAYVYSWVNGDWGNKIYAELFGTTSVDLSSDGSTLVVGAAEYSATFGGETIGSVRVFRDNGGDEIADQLGGALDSFYSGTDSARIGSDVSISADGTTVAIGAKLADDSGGSDHGRVVIFDWTGSAWRKRDDIIGDYANDNIGHAVKISEDGLRLAFSSLVISDQKGQVTVYEWDSECGGLSYCCLAN